MYLLKIKCSSPVPVRSEGPETQVQTLEQVESQEKDSKLGQNGWKGLGVQLSCVGRKVS